MKKYIAIVLFFATIAVSTWIIKTQSKSESLKTSNKSIFTDLSVTSCKEIIDQDDPNATPYRKCPGLSGYTLIRRHVDSGRVSISVLTPAQIEFPLDYQEFITRHMFQLDDTVEWRVVINNGKEVPIAIISHVRSHEDMDEPDKITNTYLAVAKIAPNEICVTDRILADTLSRKEIVNTADSAPEKECLQPLPPITVE